MTSFPILDYFNKSFQISNELINSLREQMIERFEKNSHLYYSSDMDRIKTNDWSVARFLVVHRTDPTNALENLDKALKWRKSYNVLDLTDKDFPKELYLSAGLFLYGRDRNGSQLMIMRAKVSKKMKEWTENGQQFLVYLIEKADKENEGKGLTLLMDCVGAGIRNANIEALKFLRVILNEYYPGLVYSSLIFKMPIIFETIYRLVRSWLNEEQVKYIYLINSKTIDLYVERDQLPDVLTGTNIQPYRTAPEDAPTAHNLAQSLGMREEMVDKFVTHLQQFYNN